MVGPECQVSGFQLYLQGSGGLQNTHSLRGMGWMWERCALPRVFRRDREGELEVSMNCPKSHDEKRAEAGLNPHPSVPVAILPP